MKIAVGCDHRGYRIKLKLMDMLTAMGHTVVDHGTHDDQSVDYPDFASTVSRNVSEGDVDRGILICGTGSAWPLRQTSFPAFVPPPVTTKGRHASADSTTT